jgi:UDP-glucose 4-epimerase
MVVLITGGAGYIGTELVKMLNRSGKVDKIIIYDNLSRNNYNIFLHSAIPHGKVQFVKGELLDTRKVKELLKEVEVVYHLAARVSTPLSNESSHLFEQVNNWGTAEMVYAIEESNVKRVIYTSSLSVYGTSEEMLDINSTTDPQSFYGISKHRGEQHIRRLSDIKDTYILRCANIYGCGTSLRFDAVINKMMFEACFLKRITIHGDGSQQRTFIQIRKAASILSSLLDNTLPSGTYNMVGRTLSISEIAGTILDILPETEMVFINQHMKMRELKVKKDERLTPLCPDNDITFRDEMIAFRDCFYQSSI